MSTPIPPISRSKRIAFQTVALFFGLLVISIVGELLLRLFPQLVNDPPAPPPFNYRTPHEQVGWVVKGNYQHEGELRDFKGTPYPLRLGFAPNGFRKWGDPGSRRKKVLFIGDSYTACAQTSDDKVFYKILGDSLPIEVFAYGAAGFSNVQEYLIAAHYFPEIKPDLVVWQLCSNDFIDNYWALEEKAAYHVRMRRPYLLEDGSTVYHLAAEWPRSLKPYSHFLYFILKRVGELRGTFDQPPRVPAEQLIAEQNQDYEPFARSLRMTDVAFKKMKALLLPDTKILVFNADSFNPQYDHFECLCRENGLPFAGGLDAFVRQAEAAGECTRSDDGYHWNDRGNALVAAFLRPQIEQQLIENQ